MVAFISYFPDTKILTPAKHITLYHLSNILLSLSRLSQAIGYLEFILS
jgi:hypothetical protein